MASHAAALAPTFPAPTTDIFLRIKSSRVSFIEQLELYYRPAEQIESNPSKSARRPSRSKAAGVSRVRSIPGSAPNPTGRLSRNRFRHRLDRGLMYRVFQPLPNGT